MTCRFTFIVVGSGDNLNYFEASETACITYYLAMVINYLSPSKICVYAMHSMGVKSPFSDLLLFSYSLSQPNP